jgi:RNA polymerase primary sigma factor
MSPAATKSAAAKPAIVMVADADGKPKTVKAAEKKSATSKGKAAAKSTTKSSRSRSAGLKPGDNLNAAADALLAAADQKSASKATGKTAAAKTASTKKASTKAAAANDAAAKDAAANEVTAKPETTASAEKDAKAKALASIKIGPKGVYTEDSIRVYLQEIGRIRLLRPDEEIELARKIADLLLLEELAAQFESDNGREPDTKEWAALVEMPVIKFRRRLMLGRRAKEKMVQSNLRLVVSIAKKYMNRGLSFQDLIQEGSLGLIRAAEKFDHEKGYKFSTYATSPAPSVCRCTSTRPSHGSRKPPRCSARNSVANPPRRKSPNRWR